MREGEILRGGFAPSFLNKFPLSFEGEGDRGGEVETIKAPSFA
jgi:hypothetical protein